MSNVVRTVLLAVVGNAVLVLTLFFGVGANPTTGASIEATKTVTLAQDIDTDGVADPGDTLRYTLVMSNTGSVDATGVMLFDAIDANTTISGTFHTTPLARHDSYTVFTSSLTIPASDGVLSNDNDPDGDMVTASGGVSGAGGTVVVNSDGSFTYVRPSSVVATDVMTYTITDAAGNTDLANVFLTLNPITVTSVPTLPVNQEAMIADHKAGAVTESGKTLEVDFGTMNPGQIVTTTFEAMIDPSIPPLVTEVCNQGIVSWDDNVGDLLTEEICTEVPQADCSQATPSIATLWPPNHKFVAIQVLGVTDPDGHPIVITIDSIWQDEPVDSPGGGSFTPDGRGVGAATAEVRAERSGTGNGRVYHINFTAADEERGGTCSGEVLVGVPYDQGQGAPPFDDGPLYDSTIGS